MPSPTRRAMIRGRPMPRPRHRSWPAPSRRWRMADRLFEWGPTGARQLAPGVDVLIVFDVLSFSTSVDVAVARGAAVYPARWKDERAAELARDLGAELAVGRSA